MLALAAGTDFDASLHRLLDTPANRLALEGSLRVLGHLSHRVAYFGRFGAQKVLPDAVNRQRRQHAHDRNDDHELNQRETSFIELLECTHRLLRPLYGTAGYP
jgi:hypothetical protein